MFGTVRNHCIYNRAIFKNLAYLEPRPSSKVCGTCKMIMHIQSPSLVRTVYPKHYSATLTGTEFGGGEASNTIFEN